MKTLVFIARRLRALPVSQSNYPPASGAEYYVISSGLASLKSTETTCLRQQSMVSGAISYHHANFLFTLLYHIHLQDGLTPLLHQGCAPHGSPAEDVALA